MLSKTARGPIGGDPTFEFKNTMTAKRAQSDHTVSHLLDRVYIITNQTKTLCPKIVLLLRILRQNPLPVSIP